MLKINKGELLNAMQFIISAVTPDKVMNPSYNAVWFDVSQDTAVEHVDNDQITLQFVDNTSPMQIKNTNSLHIIMPIRMT